MNWLALDIGGANIKASDGSGYAVSHGLKLWADSSQLARELRTMIAESPGCDHLAVTMTGELADCFETRTEGVRFILQAVEQAADGRHTRVYLHDGRLVTVAVAAQLPLLAASSNWHALARFVGRYAPRGVALLIDIGSTTCDIIPLRDGVPVPAGTTDTDRLLSGELVYTGVERSPLCGVVSSVPYRGQLCPVAQELFATTKDVYLILGKLPEQTTDTNTADGRPATRRGSRIRLGRMLAANEEQFNHKDAVAIAEAVFEVQAAQIMAAAERVRSRVGSPAKVIISGQGEFLARRVVEQTPMFGPAHSLAAELGVPVSRSATAHALAVLAREAVSR
jgi:probable H4MPT-linked C1 transfer pathway protein